MSPNPPTRRLRRRINIVAGVLLALSFILSGVVQHEQSKLKIYVQGVCEGRRANALHTNATWTELERIETHNKFIDAQIRAERLAAYENAKLIVPVCTT